MHDRNAFRGAVAIGMVIALTVFSHGTALADHNEPAEAEEFESSLVRAFAECTAPNTTSKTRMTSTALAVRFIFSCFEFTSL